MTENEKKSTGHRGRASLYADCRDDPQLPDEFNASCKDTDAPVPVGDALKKLARWWIALPQDIRMVFYFQGFDAMLRVGFTPAGEHAAEPTWVASLRQIIQAAVEQAVETKLYQILASEEELDKLVRGIAQVAATCRADMRFVAQSRTDTSVKSQKIR